MNSVRDILGINNIHDRHIMGKDITFVVMDTGIYEHPDFNGRIIKFVDFIKGKRRPYDDNGHGTHVAGILAGNGRMSHGQYRGMCPESKLIVLKVLDEKGKGKEENVIRACNWIVDNRIDYNINIVNISFGTLCKEEKCLETKMIKAVEKMWDNGLIIVAAAGNMGPEDETITSPGISKKIITVGAMDDKRTIELDGKIVKDYSGRGNSREKQMKPDLIAPGTRVISCAVHSKKNKGFYRMKSGTSMAVPVVCGTIGLFMEQNKDISNNEIKKLLKISCSDRGMPMNRQGAGLINPEKFLKMR